MTEKQKKLVENYIRLQVKKRLNETISTVDPDQFLKNVDNFQTKLENLASYSMTLFEQFEMDDSKEGKILFRKIEDDIVGPVGAALNNLEKLWPLFQQFAKLQKTRSLNINRSRQ